MIPLGMVDANWKLLALDHSLGYQLGMRLGRFMEMSGVSGRQIAEALDEWGLDGITQPTISRIVTGFKSPDGSLRTVPLETAIALQDVTEGKVRADRDLPLSQASRKALRVLAHEGG